MKVTKSDYAATCPWSGITGKPDIIGVPGPRGPAGPAGPAGTPGAPGSDDIMMLSPVGLATLRQPPGLPFGPTQKVWWQECFDIRQYGAAGDGSTDDITAVNRAIADLIAAGGGMLRVPAGTYYLGSTPTEITVPCSIMGDGIGVAMFHVDGDGFSGGSDGQSFEVAELTIVTDGTSGTAISLTDGTGAGDDELFNFHHLDLRGFSTGIAVDAVARRGFMSHLRINPLSFGINCSCLGLVASDIMMLNLGDTSAIGMQLNGDHAMAHGLRFVGGGSRWDRAIVVGSGDGVVVSDVLVYGTTNAAIDLATSGRVRCENLTFGDVQGSPPVIFDPALHYVNELTGIGANADDSYDDRKELGATVTWDAGNLMSLESDFVDLSVAGASEGDQVVVGMTTDGTADEWLQVSGRVIAADTVRITLTNMGLSDIDLGSGDYKVRILN